MSRWRKVILGLLLLFAAGGAFVFWYVRSGRIESYIVQRAKAELEKSLGAKLEIRSLRLDILRGKAVAEGVVLHGKEDALERPLFEAASIEIEAGLTSLDTSKVSLRGLILNEPKFHLINYADGTTNLPGPKTRRSGPGRGAVETFLNWRLGHLEIRKGEFDWKERRTPFEVSAKDFLASMDYLPASRTYRGKLQTAQVHLQPANLAPIDGESSVDFQIAAEKVDIERATFQSADGTKLTARGEIRNVESTEASPLRIELDVEGTVAVKQVRPYLKLPIEASGLVTYNGKFLFEKNRGIELHGDASGRDLFYRDESTRLGPLTARARVDLVPVRLTLTKLRAEGLGGTLDGGFRWDQKDGWTFDGDLSSVDLATVLNQVNVRGLPWSGLIAGPVKASGGKAPLAVEANLEIVSISGPSPMNGVVALSYFENGNRLISRDSFLALPNSRLNFAGDLAKGIGLEFRTTDVNELMPVLRLAGWREEKPPVELRQGSFQTQGMLTGTVKSPHYRGTAAGTNVVVEGYRIAALRGRIDYQPELLSLDGLEVERNGDRASGQVKVALDDGKLSKTSALSGNVTLEIADLQRALTELGVKENVAGAATIVAALKGNFENPQAQGSVKSPSVTVREIALRQVSAAFEGSRRELKVPQWEARFGTQALRGTVELKAGGNDWKLGSGSGAIKADAIALRSIPQYRQENYDVDATVTADVQTVFTWNPEGVSPSKLDGRLLLANITRYGRPVGQLEFTSRTSGVRASLTATGNLRQLPVKGDATIQLGSKLDTELRLQLPRIDFPSMAQLFSRDTLPSPLPYEGGAEASLYFNGPLLDPQGWDGRLTIPQLQLSPNKEYVKETLPAVAELSLKNEGPIVVEFRRGLIGARDVRLVAKDTNLTTSFLYRTATQGISGSAKGTINLALLSTLQPDLIAAGAAALDTSLQGTASDPQINGKLSFQNASFYLRDVITGLDKVNGTLLFDKSRATIEDLKAQTGGGELQLSGFVGFGKSLSYRLQAQANQVRLRYPEGVSTSANATLALTGTTAQSILTGSVLILRSNIGQIDTAQLLGNNAAAGGGDSTAPVNNEFLRNLQFDVRVEAAPNAEFSTALTKDIKGEITLRVRGTPQRPIVLGRIAVTQGEIDFFGSRYEINRGEVQFNNSLRIEPVINLDLETRVRGVTIALNFSGLANKLNINYRSDPPLQSNEILALLTVGRNPGTSTSLAQTPVGQSQGLFGNDSSVILGAAVTAGINGRLQRFFGISRVRLDPQLTGIDNVPQARLTLEQQVSRNVTLTYITNLNRTQQQIVRLDWDISRTWSVVAVRDENGIFGVDLFFRKRLR